MEQGYDWNEAEFDVPGTGIFVNTSSDGRDLYVDVLPLHLVEKVVLGLQIKDGRDPWENAGVIRKGITDLAEVLAGRGPVVRLRVVVNGIPMAGALHLQRPGTNVERAQSVEWAEFHGLADPKDTDRERTVDKRVEELLEQMGPNPDVDDFLDELLGPDEGPNGPEGRTEEDDQLKGSPIKPFVDPEVEKMVDELFNGPEDNEGGGEEEDDKDGNGDT